MKNIQKIAFLVLLSLACSNIDAGKNHNASLTECSTDNKKPKLDGEDPRIHLKPYTLGQELKTNGPCEILPDGSKFCCDIQPHYIVECCLHPSTTGLSRSVLFDPIGIIGDESTPNTDNITTNESDIRTIYEQIKKTFNIQNETEAFIKKVKNTNHTIETYLETYKDDIQIINLRSKEWNHVMPVSVINNSDMFPSLIHKIIHMIKKYNLQNTPLIGIYDAPLEDFPMATTTLASNRSLLIIPIQKLQMHSDEEITFVLNHEFQHLKQQENQTPTGNNIEAEANIAQTLAIQNPYLGNLLIMRRKHPLNSIEESLTRENLDERLLTSRPEEHQSMQTEILSMCGIYKNLKKARAILGLEQ